MLSEITKSVQSNKFNINENFALLDRYDSQMPDVIEIDWLYHCSSEKFLLILIPSQDTSRVTTGRRAHCIHHAPSLRNFSFSIEINLMCDSSISHPFPLSFLCAALAHAASPDALRCVPVHSLQKYFIKIFYRMLRDPGPDQSFSYNTSVTRLSSLLFISAI